MVIVHVASPANEPMCRCEQARTYNGDWPLQGDELVADGIVFESSSLAANEAALTGESDDIKKNPKTAPFVYSGTQIMDGVGKYVGRGIRRRARSLLVPWTRGNWGEGVVKEVATGTAMRLDHNCVNIRDVVGPRLHSCVGKMLPLMIAF
jgi:hypothetical protein